MGTSTGELEAKAKTSVRVAWPHIDETRVRIASAQTLGETPAGRAASVVTPRSPLTVVRRPRRDASEPDIFPIFCFLFFNVLSQPFRTEPPPPSPIGRPGPNHKRIPRVAKREKRFSRRFSPHHQQELAYISRRRDKSRGSGLITIEDKRDAQGNRRKIGPVQPSGQSVGRWSPSGQAPLQV